MATAEVREVLSVDKDQLYQTIIRYEDYPKFVEGCKSVQVDRKGDGHALVTYTMSIIKEISYVLEHREDPVAGLVEWKLVSGDFFKKNSGSWKIQSAGPGKTDALYSVDVEFNFPVPGMIVNKLVKSNLPALMRGMEKRAKLNG